MSRVRSPFVMFTASLLSVIVVTGLMFVAPQQVHGATAAPGSGLKISPNRADLTIDKGASRTVTISVENTSSAAVTLAGVVNDFLPSTDESGKALIVLDETQRDSGNSFKTIVGDVSTVELGPKERKDVSVTLTVPAAAASGGYYGAVRFTPSSGVENAKDLALSASAGTIFLVRVPGNITERLSIEGMEVTQDGKANTLFTSGPFAISTRFRNFGNIHVQPYGKITIKNFSGKTIEVIEINDTQPRGSVLPTSIRKFDTAVNQQKFFGKYTVEGSFGYGNNGEVLMASKTFYVVPYKLIGGILAIILVMVFGLPRLIRSVRERRAAKELVQQSASKPKAKPQSRKRD